MLVSGVRHRGQTMMGLCCPEGVVLGTLEGAVRRIFGLPDFPSPPRCRGLGCALRSMLSDFGRAVCVATDVEPTRAKGSFSGSFLEAGEV